MENPGDPAARYDRECKFSTLIVSSVGGRRQMPVEAGRSQSPSMSETHNTTEPTDDRRTSEQPSGGSTADDVSSGIARRRFITASAAGAATAWAIPSIISVQAAAAGTLPPEPPGIIDRPKGYDAPKIGRRSVEITAGHVGGEMELRLRPGDLWIGVATYDARGTITLADAEGPSSSYNEWLDGLGGDDYSVQAYVAARVIKASDLVDDTYTTTFETSTDVEDYGGLRVFAIVLRYATPLSIPSVTSNTGTGPLAGDGYVTAEFPEAASMPATTPNVSVRIGAARGYAGDPANLANPWDHLQWSIDDPLDSNGDPIDIWAKGGDMLSNDGGNVGDRAIYIFTEPDAQGGKATQKWQSLLTDVPADEPKCNWVTFNLMIFY